MGKRPEMDLGPQLSAIDLKCNSGTGHNL